MNKYRVEFFNNGDFMQTHHIITDSIADLLDQIAFIIKIYNEQYLLFNITYTIEREG